MNREQVRQQVIKCLLDLAPVSNQEPMNENTNPMLKLGLDSHDGVNLACILSEEFRCEVPNEVNPLVDDERHRPRLIGEITDLVCKLMVGREEEAHG
jgi:acyl carrier protein